jgi:hypothetical protein
VRGVLQGGARKVRRQDERRDREGGLRVPALEVVVYQNRVYKLCCKKCVGRFEKDPAKYAKEYDAMVASQGKPADGTKK